MTSDDFYKIVDTDEFKKIFNVKGRTTVDIKVYPICNPSRATDSIFTQVTVYYKMKSGKAFVENWVIEYSQRSKYAWVSRTSNIIYVRRVPRIPEDIRCYLRAFGLCR